MNDNLWYYHRIAAPLHNHKSYDDQMIMISDMYSNLTLLSTALDTVKENLDTWREKY
jgi:hypothetical protein